MPTDPDALWFAARSTVPTWRKRAAEMRAVAEDMRDPEANAHMLRIAGQYEHLAQRAEERSNRGGR
jgi:hypothetical protein